MSRYGHEHGTPYIPPLEPPVTPEHSPNPVIPDPQTRGTLPGWANGAVGSSHYAGYNQPGATPWPQNQNLNPPGAGNMFQPTSYFAVPTGLPPQTPYPQSGYPYHVVTPAHNPLEFNGWAAQPTAAPAGYGIPNPSWGPAPAQPRGTAMGPPMSTQPVFAAPLPPVAYPPLYGYPQQGVPTPYVMYGGGLPYGQSPANRPISAGGNGNPGHPGMHSRNTSIWGFLGRTDKDNCDLPPSKFEEGPNYGPVLNDICLKKSGVDQRLSIHPILESINVADERSAPNNVKRHLEWDLRYDLSVCKVVDPDGRRIAFRQSKEYKEPATWPRVLKLRLVIKPLPWLIEVAARRENIGVTCRDVIEAVEQYFSRRVTADEVTSFKTSQGREAYRQMAQAYHYNRGNNPGAPGPGLGEGMRRVDMLCQFTSFFGILRHDTLVRQKSYGALPPATFELVCTTWSPEAATLPAQQQQQTGTESLIDQMREGLTGLGRRASRSRRRSAQFDVDESVSSA